MTRPTRSGRRSALTACLHTDAVLERIRCYLDGETLLSAVQVDSAWYDAEEELVDIGKRPGGC